MMNVERIRKIIEELEAYANELKWVERLQNNTIDQWAGGRERAQLALQRLQDPKTLETAKLMVSRIRTIEL